ncbi:NAD(P)H-binding protein [Dactylosporangium sp. NPDC051541]|uniref:NAD(P)H-binding protein n=1 Tax=Dactylosporangium sp. NPDC051541 TaxID=3363977 RepID=UPI003798EC4E
MEPEAIYGEGRHVRGDRGRWERGPGGGRGAARAGVAVRALVRDPASVAAPEGVELVRGDLADPAALGPAMEGADAVFLLPGYPGLAAAARAAGVRRIVQLSGGSAGSADRSNAVTSYMNDAEAEMRDSGLEWTVLRPAAFMSNALRWNEQIRGGVVRLPFADVPLATVHPRDIAAVAAVAMTEDGHQSMIYRPTGPVALSPPEQVAILGEALGRSLRFEAQPNGEARREMLTTTPAA